MIHSKWFLPAGHSLEVRGQRVMTALHPCQASECAVRDVEAGRYFLEASPTLVAAG